MTHKRSMKALQAATRIVNIVLLIQVDHDGNRFISVSELGRALELVGIKLPAYQVRDLLRQFDVTLDDRLNFNEFKKVS